MERKKERRSGCNNFLFTPVFETPKRGSGGSASRWGLSSTPPTLAPLTFRSWRRPKRNKLVEMYNRSTPMCDVGDCFPKRPPPPRIDAPAGYWPPYTYKRFVNVYRISCKFTRLQNYTIGASIQFLRFARKFGFKFRWLSE